MRRIALVVLTALALSSTASFAAHAAGQCYELIGCASSQYFKKQNLLQLGCQPLWEVRNRIYKDRGYCFHTKAGINLMGNGGCHINDQGSVPLNSYESANVAAIRSVERAKGCHFGE
jgi:hypothetical protein